MSCRTYLSEVLSANSSANEFSPPPGLAAVFSASESANEVLPVPGKPWTKHTGGPWTTHFLVSQSDSSCRFAPMNSIGINGEIYLHRTRSCPECVLEVGHNTTEWFATHVDIGVLSSPMTRFIRASFQVVVLAHGHHSCRLQWDAGTACSAVAKSWASKSRAEPLAVFCELPLAMQIGRHRMPMRILGNRKLAVAGVGAIAAGRGIHTKVSQIEPLTGRM